MHDEEGMPAREGGSGMSGACGLREPIGACWSGPRLAKVSQPEITGRSICNYLHVADYMIAYAWQSCCGERVGSHINIVKSLERTLLSDSMFDDHTFNKCNLPELHEIDYEALVKIWKEGAKERVGIFKGCEAVATEEQSRSKVVKRHQARTSSQVFQFSKSAMKKYRFMKPNKI